MATNYVLVDFENVQPDSLAALANGPFRVKVFVGAAQAKGRISFELSHSMQMLGASAEYVRIARTGKNAVDMHIAYYVGRLLEKEPGAMIHIVSKDTDFDPLIEYLRAIKLVHRVAHHDLRYGVAILLWFVGEIGDCLHFVIRASHGSTPRGRVRY